METLTWLQNELELLDKKQLRRSLRHVELKGNGRLTVDGRSLVNFSSNDYLGLAHHPTVIDAAKKGLERWGLGATASRLISGSSAAHEELERSLAAYLNREAALVFPSGYMANLAIVTTLVGPSDAVIVDRLTHASLIDAIRLSGARLFVYAHADAQDAERALQRAASYRRRLLISDGLFSMDGDFAPTEGLLTQCRKYKAISLFDEAHAIGIWPLQSAESDVLVGTLSKAFGSQGGFVCGSQQLIDSLVNRARSFIFTTGLSPACAAGALAALSLMRDDSTAAERVKRLSQRLRHGFLSQGRNIVGSESQIVPVWFGNSEQALTASATLLNAGFFAPAIRPPAVHAGECRIRFSVTADHTEDDIDQLLEAVRRLTPNPLPVGEGPTRRLAGGEV